MPLLVDNNNILTKMLKESTQEPKEPKKGLIFVYRDEKQQYKVDTIFDYTNEQNIYPNDNNIANYEDFLKHIDEYINPSSVRYQ